MALADTVIFVGVAVLPVVVPLWGLTVNQVALELMLKFVTVLEDRLTVLVPGVVLPVT